MMMVFSYPQERSNTMNQQSKEFHDEVNKLKNRSKQMFGALYEIFELLDKKPELNKYELEILKITQRTFINL
jgi:hypothetical protein